MCLFHDSQKPHSDAYPYSTQTNCMKWSFSCQDYEPDSQESQFCCISNNADIGEWERAKQPMCGWGMNVVMSGFGQNIVCSEVFENKLWTKNIRVSSRASQRMDSHGRRGIIVLGACQCSWNDKPPLVGESGPSGKGGVVNGRWNTPQIYRSGMDNCRGQMGGWKYRVLFVVSSD